MKSVFLLVLGLIGGALAADITDPDDCTAYPCLIFEDNFDFLDYDVWTHEMTMGGGGNGEFEVYVNNRSVSYTRDGTFFIKPNLVSDWQGEDFLLNGDLDLWGMNGRNDICTSAMYDGCRKQGDGTHVINPVMSARVRTLGAFSFRYGRVEIRAKMPRGDWLWPAIWLLPDAFKYGSWPASGEIDIIESRGNDVYGDQGNQYAGTTLHWGTYLNENRYYLTHSEYPTADGSSFADDFHVWSTEWNENGMVFSLDGTVVLTVDPGTSFFDFGNFNSAFDNPWSEGSSMAPFDQKFYIVLNLAVGGTGGFFPDDITPTDPPKPWRNDDGENAMTNFWNDRANWLPSWEQGEGRISENAALQIDYIQVYKTSAN